MRRLGFYAFFGRKSVTLGLFAIGLVLGTDPVLAQNTGTIVGRVLSETEQPLVGVPVFLVGTSLGTLSGANGRYSLVNVPAGNYRLRVERIGTRTVEVAVTVQAGQSLTQDFTL